MSSCCLTYADVDEAMLEDELATEGVTVSYYPQLFTAYNTATTTRTPSEDGAVSVTGKFYDLSLTAGEDTIQRTATFWLAHDDTLGFTPTPLDRLVMESKSYRATQIKIDQSGATPLSYTLTLASD